MTRDRINAQAARLFPIEWTFYGGIEDNGAGDMAAKARTARALAARAKYPENRATCQHQARVYAAASRQRVRNPAFIVKRLGRCVVVER